MVTPAEQLQQDVRKWRKFHPFVPDGTAGAFCGSRSPYEDKCSRRETEEVHTQTYTMTLEQMATQERGTQTLNAFTFNPPPASEMEDNLALYGHPQRLPYELKRKLTHNMGVAMRREARTTEVNGRQRRVYDGPEHYYVSCRRSRSSRTPCHNDIEVYKVVTGTRQTENHGHTMQVEDYVYYWPDDALVVELGSLSGMRTIQTVFCSHKCLSLWAAKVARDTGE